MVPLQLMLTGTTPLRANAASMGAIVPISLAGALVYYLAGRSGQPAVDLSFAAILVVGGVLGAYAGARLAGRLPGVWLARLLAALLALVGLKELLFP